VESAREALAAWFTKIKEIDKNAIIYPWTLEDQKNKEKCLEKPSDIPFLLSNMKKYFHKLYIHAKGETYYPQVMVGLMELPTKFMEKISWWLQFMEQGMWVSPLQLAEDNTCLGWLLYSADEYDQEALCNEIWAFVGVKVALQFREIDDSVPCKDRSPRTPCPKALHIEIDKGDPASCWQALEKLYSSSANMFPLGIKMRLVWDHKLLTNMKAKAKAASL